VVRATGNYNLPLFGIATVVLVSAILFSRVDCSRGLNTNAIEGQSAQEFKVAGSSG
jgi:MFS transporter, ACS family, glucarate transporter